MAAMARPPGMARQGRVRRIHVRATGAPGANSIKLTNLYSEVTPQGNKILLKLAPEATMTPGGLLLPTSEQKKPTMGEVLSCGPGATNTDVGAYVLYSKWGFMTQEVEMGEDTLVLVKEEDLLGKFAKMDATVDDIPDLQPVGDRVLLKVDEAKSSTSGGMLIAGTQKERPVQATVVAVGPGAKDKTGKFVPTELKEGDRVVYFRWAGDALDLRSGDTYVIIPERDILGKMGG